MVCNFGCSVTFWFRCTTAMSYTNLYTRNLLCDINGNGFDRNIRIINTNLKIILQKHEPKECWNMGDIFCIGRLSETWIF